MSSTLNELCELNVKQQVENLAHNTIVQKAWERGRKLFVHGWIYSVADGLFRDLHVTRRGASLREPGPGKGRGDRKT